MASDQEKARARRNRERDRLLKMLPDDATRVQVRDREGKIRNRLIHNVEDYDEIQTKKDGTPIFMRGSPGRRAVLDMTKAASPVHAKLVAQKEAALREDPLTKMVSNNPESPDVLQEIMRGLAEEAASIGFERKKAERENKDTSSLSVRRAQTLKAVGETWLRRKEQIVSNTIDMESPGFHVLMGLVLETFRGAMVDSKIDEDLIQVVFARFSKRVETEEWKNEAKNRMRRNV
jgi:hypothetical protein